MDQESNKIKRKNADLVEENQALKAKMAKMKAFYIKELKVLHRRQMPAELMNELFASLPIENAFVLLAKMPNGLLASNVQRMINGIKEEMKNNKLNEEDCSPNLTISKQGLAVIFHSTNIRGPNCVRAILPIPSFNLHVNKPQIAFYFEMQILSLTSENINIAMGFCDKELPLDESLMENKGLGMEKNTIGIDFKYGGINIDGLYIKLENEDENTDFNGDADEDSNEKVDEDVNFDEDANFDEDSNTTEGYLGDNFEKDDVIGLGLIHHPNSKLKCFATCNGKFLGKAELPAKFVELQLFPAICMVIEEESILANFGKEKWNFKEFGRVLK